VTQQSKQQTPRRRAFLSSALSGASLLSAPTVIGSSENKQPANSEPRGFHLDENGDAQFTTTEPPCGASSLRGVEPSCTAARLVSRRYETASQMNDLVDQGRLDVWESGDTLYVEPTRDPEDLIDSADSHRPAPVSCGKTTWSFSEEDWIGFARAYSLNLWYDDDATDQLVKLLGATAAANEIAAIIISLTGWGAVPGYVLHGVTVLLTYYTLDISTTNEGCGVKIENYVQSSLPVPTYDVLPQDNRDPRIWTV